MNNEETRSPRVPRSFGRVAFVAIVTLAAAGLAVICFRAGCRELPYDSGNYYGISRFIAAVGLWKLSGTYPMYGYPLFVSACTGFSPRSPEATRAYVFVIQLALYLGTSLFAARVAERMFHAPRFFFGTYAVMALNPIVLIHTTEVLTDLLSAVLLLLAVMLSVERPHPFPRMTLAFLCAGLAVAVRATNLAILPALMVIWGLRAVRFRDVTRSMILLSAAGLAIPFLPQLNAYRRASGRWNPPEARSVYGEELAGGLHVLKYGTLIVPGEDPVLLYFNPFYPANASSPREFFERRPLGYLATIGLHAFAILDQDLPFTYITDPTPWYRWPLGIANYTFLFLAGVGMAAGLRRISARPAPAPQTLYFGTVGIASLSYAVLYLPVAVENRFSLPSYLFVSPAVIFAIGLLAGAAASRRWAGLAVTTIAGVSFIAVCVRVSLWLSAQAPALVRLSGR